MYRYKVLGLYLKEANNFKVYRHFFIVDMSFLMRVIIISRQTAY